MTDLKKVGIIGCGHVGATIAYTLMESGMFNEMVLVDTNDRKAHGEAMDLGHCLPFLTPMQIYESSYSALSDAGIIVIAAGVNQKEGETRLDLLNNNVKIFKSIVERICEVNQKAIILVVSNPVDILTYVTLTLSRFDSARVIGSGTVLDTARLKFRIGTKLDVDYRNVHSFIIGEHGDSELAVWSSANVSGIDLTEYCEISGKCSSITDLYGIFDYVKNSAYDIIRDKGATYYAVAQATKKIVGAIVRDENAILPVSTLVSGHYGLDDICLSVPAVIGKSGVKKVLDIPLSADEERRLKMSADTIRESIESLNLYAMS